MNTHYKAKEQCKLGFLRTSNSYSWMTGRGWREGGRERGREYGGGGEEKKPGDESKRHMLYSVTCQLTHHYHRLIHWSCHPSIGSRLATGKPETVIADGYKDEFVFQ